MRLSAFLFAATAAAPAMAAEPIAPIRLNQVGLFSEGRKVAILPDASSAPLAWHLKDRTGRTRASGVTRVFGPDRWSGEAVHQIDFSTFRQPGEFRLQVDERVSRTFPIASAPTGTLPRQALAFFYHQRAGVPIEARLVGARWARPAGHVKEVATCVRGRDPHGNVWPGCHWSLDVTGGWYDAGDHGKYVVNGGIALWTLLNLHEYRPGAFADGSAILPERGNGVPDLLDEARFQLEFLLKMQVPDGRRIRVPVGVKRGGPNMAFQDIDASGMVHHKVADERWTGIPLRPDEDREKRQLFSPTTAATLNLAAVTAQCARIWRTIDARLAAACLNASERAYSAAIRNPSVYAVSDFSGSGGYGDEDVDDEFFWATAELFVTTGGQRYRQAIRRAPFLRQAAASEPGWPSTSTLGLITLAQQSPFRSAARRAITAAADGFLRERQQVGYAIPYAPDRGWPWGSTSSILNRAMLLGLAHDYTGAPEYLGGVIDGLDFLLGRNPLDRSFVSGFGARPMRNPHHRFWANLPERGYPAPPPGALSGGPNSINSPRADEPVGPLKGCAPQTCWVDDVGSFTTNEVAINWNAPLVWVSSWLHHNARAAR